MSRRPDLTPSAEPPWTKCPHCGGVSSNGELPLYGCSKAEWDALKVYWPREPGDVRGHKYIDTPCPLVRAATASNRWISDTEDYIIAMMAVDPSILVRRAVWSRDDLNYLLIAQTREDLDMEFGSRVGVPA